MQIKTTVKYHLTLIRMAASVNQQVLEKMWRKGNTFALLVVMQIGIATVESNMELPQNLKMEPPYDTVIPVLRIYLEKP